MQNIAIPGTMNNIYIYIYNEKEIIHEVIVPSMNIRNVIAVGICKCIHTHSSWTHEIIS